MYAIIFDEHDSNRLLKQILSVHRTRSGAETVLGQHRKTHGRSFQECRMRIVWTKERIRVGDCITPRQFETWRPGETVPAGEMRSDGD